MGAIRWTGTGLKLLGGLLEGEEFETWLRDRLETLPVAAAKQLRSDRTARNDLRNEVDQSIRSETFRSALAATLGELPSMVGQVANSVRRNGSAELCMTWLGGWLAVVPRAAVQTQYTELVMNDLGGSAELANFERFPEIFLQSKARESERSFFALVTRKRPFELSNDRRMRIVDIDGRFDWGLGGDPGHYYCAYADSPRFDRRRQRREFANAAQSNMGDKRILLGRLSAEGRAAAVAIFR